MGDIVLYVNNEYLYMCLLWLYFQSLEDLCSHYDLTVRNSMGDIPQFVNIEYLCISICWVVVFSVSRGPVLTL